MRSQSCWNFFRNASMQMSTSIGMNRWIKTRELMNIFWSHASQRAECYDFGDVIIFDMTHKTNNDRIPTNNHMMPLGMFVGSNHQLQNVIFGQALMRDESDDSFKFTTFKTCMGGHEPHVLLTGTVMCGISSPT
jgi:hypothetical protein